MQKMSTIECPPTPPTLPEGEAAITPPPKSLQKSESEEKSDNDRSSSPSPSCAICLGKLENVAHTDTCMHKFCFVCLLEWSKVRPVCPLCKSKFKSIIHNIKSDDDYDSYKLPEPPPRPYDGAITIDGNVDHEEARRFRYRTTMPIHNDFLQQMRIEEIRAEVERWRQELPNILPPNPTRVQQSAGSLWTRRRGAATSEFRRDIYRRNMYLDPESVQDLAGRVRECSPAWYRTNPAQTHRLVPWLNRELNALLEGSEHQSCYVTQKILQYIERFNIQSPEFHEKLLPYLGTRTDHFQHEFYHYARSPHDMIAFDRYATYTYQNPVNEISDEDDIMVVDEVVRPAQTILPLPLPPPPPLAVSPIFLASPPRASPSPPQMTPIDLSAPSTSTGISSNLTRLVIPASDSDISDSNGKADDVEVVGVVKPRHERTPEIIDVSSENEATKTQQPAKATNEMIEISSDSDENEPKNEYLTYAQKLLEKERFLQRRILSYYEDFQKREKREKENANKSVNLDPDYIPDIPDLPADLELDQQQPSTSKDKGKGKGKGKSSKKTKEVKKKKSKKRKRSKEVSDSSSDGETESKIRKKHKKSVKKKRKRVYKDSSENSSDEENHEEKPLSRWKVSIKTMKARKASDEDDLSQQSPEHEQDLRLHLSRKKKASKIKYASSPSESSHSSDERQSQDLRSQMSRKRPPPPRPQQNFSSNESEDDDNPSPHKLRSLVFKVDSK